MIVVAYAIAILLPLGFLYLIYSQDLFGQGKFKYVLLSFAWGLLAFGGAYGIASLLKWQLTIAFGSTIEAGNWLSLWLPVLIAPVVEEVLKSLSLLLFLWKRMTYFVDGAIYGFAAGIAFSIVENILYLSRGETRTAVLLAMLRVFSTCLMHGAAAALVGTALGRLRYGRGSSRFLSAVLGWALAIGMHMGFNRLVNVGGGRGSSLVPVLGAMGIGIGGAVLIVLFIRWGLAEEKRWIQETLGLGASVTGVTKQELSRLQEYDRVDELLKQIEERFGEKKAEAVEIFLLRQAQMGIKRKARALSQDAREQEKLDGEIKSLYEEMEAIRRKAGVYCMSYVRVIPEEVLEDMASRLQRRVDEMAARPVQGKGLLETTLDRRLPAAAEGKERRPAGGPEERPTGRDIFGRVEDRQKERSDEE